MFANALARRLSRHGIHYGWVIIAVTFLTALTTAGAVGVPGALILPLTKEFGWDTAQISSALAIRLVLFGLMAPFAAALIERYGVRRVVHHRHHHDRRRPAARACHDAGLASRRPLGDHRRHRHRHDGDGAQRDHFDALVHRTARPRARHADRQFGDRTIGFPAARRLAGRAFRLALCARPFGDRPADRRPAGRPVHARPAIGRRPCAVWRAGPAPGAAIAAPPTTRIGAGLRARLFRARRDLDERHVLDSGRRPSSSAGSAPTASCRPISFRCASISACRRSPPPRRWR